MIAGLIVLAAAVVLVLIVIGMYNGLVRAKKQVENAWSQIDVQLKRRYDLIPNLVETVKGYAGHESAVLENVTRARSMRCPQALPTPARRSQPKPNSPARSGA